MDTEKNVKIEWKNLSYQVKKKVNINWWKRDEILQDIILNENGSMNTGELIAILGSSGAGKTTLLSTIAQRIRGISTGEIFFNGIKISRNDMAMRSGYIAQHEIAMHLTPREYLYFMCELKMDRNTSKWIKSNKIKRLLKEFGLISCIDTNMSSLSGGERKKLSIATELITEPPVLFCDEPTTGLDSFSALSVISILKKLTNINNNNNERKIFKNTNIKIMSNGDDDDDDDEIFPSAKSIMCSIHQPTSEIFQLFSHIILMNNGRIVFQGSTQHAQQFFSELGYICPPKYNPSDFYVKLVVSQTIKHNNDDTTVDKIYNSYKKTLDINSNIIINDKSSMKLKKLNKNCRSSWFRQVYLLTYRSALEGKRTIREKCISTAIFLITAITIVLLYSMVKGKTQSGIQDLEGAIVIMSTEIIFTFSYNVIYIIPEQLPIIRKEMGEKLYSLSAFYVSSILSLIPLTIIQCFMFLGIVCALLEPLRDFWLFLGMSATMSLAAITSSSYGYMLSGITESINITVEIAAPLDFVFLILGGFYINLSSYPYLKYISIFYFANDCLSYQFWHGVENIECSEVLGHPCMRNGTEVLREFSFGTSSGTVWLDCLGLTILFLIMHFLGFNGISRIVKKSGFY